MSISWTSRRTIVLVAAGALAAGGALTAAELGPADASSSATTARPGCLLSAIYEGPHTFPSKAALLQAEVDGAQRDLDYLSTRPNSAETVDDTARAQAHLDAARALLASPSMAEARDGHGTVIASVEYLAGTDGGYAISRFSYWDARATCS